MLQSKIFICLILSILLISCDLFKTRAPSEPSQKSSNNEPLTEPDLVIQNMINSFKDDNSVNYARSFSDESFTFEASINARNIYGVQLTGWDKEKEKKCFENIQSRIQSNSKILLEFTQTVSRLSSDICNITTNYGLQVPLKDASVKTFKGNAQFTLVRDSKTGDWSIQKWIDADLGSSTSDSTWSDLKGAFSQ